MGPYKKNMNWGEFLKTGGKFDLYYLLTFLCKIKTCKACSLIIQKTSLVPRGVDTKVFQKKKASLIKKYNILESEIVILTVANLSPQRG